MALYCFPCILFGGEDAWTKTGFTNLSKISSRSIAHAKSTKHLDNMISFNLLGKGCIQTHLSKSYQDSIKRHDEEVRKNRKVLSILIDSVLFCGQQEIALRGHNETESSLNPGGFRSLLRYASKLDVDLESHLEKSKAFLGVSATTQNDILECALEVYRKEVVSQVGQAHFVAVIADETTDISVQNQLSIVLRYIHQGNVVERFWGFFKPKRVNADGISEIILTELAKILQGNTNKVIAQTYDGASVMKGRIGGVHVKVKQVYQNAHYVHCAAHQVNLILSRAGSCNNEARLFFAKLDQIPNFFCKSPERKDAIEVSVPSVPRTRWYYSSRTVCRVATNLEELLNGFKSIVNSSDCYGLPTISAAANCIKTLEDKKFLFWLNVFAELMPDVEILYKVMQCTNLTVKKAEDHISYFQNSVARIRNSSITDHESVNLSAAAKEVCDSVHLNVAERFKFSGHLRIAQLFNEKKFAMYLSKFPSELIEEVKMYYPDVESKYLQNELKTFFQRKEMHKSGLVKTLLYLEENNLISTFSEISKLLNILITIPMCSTEAERTFSALKRIKTYLRNTMGQSRLNSLSVVSIGRDLINDCDSFNSKVMEMFIKKKERRMHFTYKGKQ